MSVVLETTLGDVTVDLFLKQRPRACLNFLKLCKIKYYNLNLFHTISRGFIAQTGDPTGSRTGGESIYGVLEGPTKRYVAAETNPRIKHTNMGLISFVGDEERMIGSQFFITLGTDLTYLDEKHCVFGEVVEGLDVVEQINEAICDTDDRPYQDIRITHTVILDDPFPDIPNLHVPSRSPSPSAERMKGGRIAADEEIDETAGKSSVEVNELIAEREAKARATILEMVGDIPDAEMAPPENVLFVCKLNPVTTDDDLEIIFSRFGKIVSCEVIKDRKSGDSLQYAFVEFSDQKSCENAYFKMDNVLIDDRRIHVDFSQSVSKIKWNGKGRGVTLYDDNGKNVNDDFGKGKNKSVKNGNQKRNRSRSPQIKRESHNYNRERSTQNNRKNSSSTNTKTTRNRSPSFSNDRRNERYNSNNTSRNYRNRSPHFSRDRNTYQYNSQNNDPRKKHSDARSSYRDNYYGRNDKSYHKNEYNRKSGERRYKKNTESSDSEYEKGSKKLHKKSKSKHREYSDSDVEVKKKSHKKHDKKYSDSSEDDKYKKKSKKSKELTSDEEKSSKRKKKKRKKSSSSSD